MGSKITQLAVSLGYKVYSGYATHEPQYGIPVKLDVRDKASVKKAFETTKPDVVIHTAALTDVDKCEVERDLAWETNVVGTRNVVEFAKGAFLIYVSTDYVFSGDRGMYREEDRPDPLNYYGFTKYVGELEVAKLREYVIARTSAIYGARPAAGKTNFALWVIEKLRKGEEIRVVTDQWLSPTLNSNLAEMILEIVERRLTGVYHLAGATRIDRYNFAKRVAEIFQLRDLIKPTSMENMTWIAKRPRDSSLDVTKAMKTLHHKPYYLETALRKLKEEYA